MIGRRDDAPRGWLQRLRVPRRQGGEDVAALRRQNAALMEEVGELTRQARTDPLTGLANRRGWNEQLSRELAQAQRSGRPVSVALMDIDDFKAFNDSRGHQAGDRLLVAAAAAGEATSSPPCSRTAPKARRTRSLLASHPQRQACSRAPPA